jgi:hypothetical protein
MSSQPSSVLLHNRYSLYVRQELAHLLFYEVFVRGRVVICQGDVECNLNLLSFISSYAGVQRHMPASSSYFALHPSVGRGHKPDSW